MAFPFSTMTSDRPTLPPLHTLDLPIPITHVKTELPSFHELYDSYERHSHSRVHWPRPRHASASSFASSRMPSLSPPPSDLSSSVSTSSLRTPSPSPPPSMRDSGAAGTFRLLPTTLDKAQAVLLVSPPNNSYVAANPESPVSPLSSPLEADGKGQALLLVGPALEHLRHPQRRLAKGVRIHPYRIVRGETSSRKCSASLAVSMS